jgi:hypothetical protein
MKPTPSNGISLEKLMVTQLIKNAQVHCCVHNSPPLNRRNALDPFQYDPIIYI